MVIVAELSADYESEVQMFENKPASLDRAEIKRVLGNQYNRFFRQQHDSKYFIGIRENHHGGTWRGEEETAQSIRGQCFNCGRKGHCAEGFRSTKKKIEKSGDTPADQNDRVKGSVCGGGEHFAHKHCGLCKRLEHRTHDCEERGAEKGANPKYW